MFADTTAFDAFAVDDLAQARTFYGRTLGIPVSEQHGLLVLHLAEGRNARVLPKPDYTPRHLHNPHVPGGRHPGRAVGELTERGVRFERYDGMDQDERGITRSGLPFAAWFTDPAGNILEVLQVPSSAVGG
jgi:catechol 2,3-dioxygenase-like lactoylglutathione lyase family enzyme